jgi:hypothetical protein
VQYKVKEIWTSLRDNAIGSFVKPDNTSGLIRDWLVDESAEFGQILR